MSNKRQQTMAKIERERTVRERRALKLERKQAAAAERKAAKEAAGFPSQTIEAASRSDSRSDALLDP